jgi:hypothetical protein
MLAHITPEEAQLLRARGGSGTINPVTGLPEFFLKKLGRSLKSAVKSVGNAVKKVVKSEVGRLVISMALATVLGPVGMALAQGGMTLATGGDLKQALVAGAMGYIGGGGTVMGYSPVSAVGGFLPGAAGSALNTGLATGVIGAGIGKIGGMSTKDALRMGLTSGLTAAAGQAYRNANAPAGAPAGQAPAEPVPAGQGPDGSTVINPDGTIGTAQDLVAATPPETAMQFSPTPDGTYAAADPAYDFNKMIGIEPAAAAVAPQNAAMQFSPMSDPDFNRAIGIDPASVSPSLGPSPTNIQIERGTLGMTGPVDTARQFMSEPINVATDFYNTNLSPSQIQARAAPQAEAAGMKAADAYTARHPTGGTAAGRELAYQTAVKAATPGMLATYGPLAAVGTAGAAALGAFKQETGEDAPLYNTAYTGVDYLRDNPQQFRGGLDTSYMRPTTPPSSVVAPTNFSAAIRPMQQAPVYMGQGISGSTSGVAQPYNMSGMYGMPLIYPVSRAKGGEMTRTEFPRKTGPINGPGTGTSDDIPAMLSDGEFVFTAKAVRNAGKGSRRKGAARMYKLMKMLEGGPVKGK